MNIPVSKKEEKGTPIKQIVLTMLYVSLGLVALASIGLIMFGVESDYGGSAFGTVGLIILTDATILLALVARHDWLKYSSWITSFLGFLFVGISIWIPYEYNSEDYIVYHDPNENIREVLGDIGWAFYLITFSLLIVGVLSLLYRKAMETNKIGRLSYWTALGAFPLGTLPAALCLALQVESNAVFPLQWRFYLSMLILSATGFAILLIAIISRSIANKSTIAPTYTGRAYPPNHPGMHNPQGHNPMQGTTPAGQGHSIPQPYPGQRMPQPYPGQNMPPTGEYEASVGQRNQYPPFANNEQRVKTQTSYPPYEAQNPPYQGNASESVPSSPQNEYGAPPQYPVKPENPPNEEKREEQPPHS